MNESATDNYLMFDLRRPWGLKAVFFHFNNTNNSFASYQRQREVRDDLLDIRSVKFALLVLWELVSIRSVGMNFHCSSSTWQTAMGRWRTAIGQCVENYTMDYDISLIDIYVQVSKLLKSLKGVVTIRSTFPSSQAARARIYGSDPLQRPITFTNAIHVIDIWEWPDLSSLTSFLPGLVCATTPASEPWAGSELYIVLLFSFLLQGFLPLVKIHRPKLLYPQYNTWKKKLFINLRSP